MNKEYKLGSKVIMKKQHPCGSNLWEITRVGVDIKINYDNYNYITVYIEGEVNYPGKYIINAKG